jgi:hypothetical protein
MGRDDYVRVVYKGYLFPFGHKASLVKVTQRVYDVAPEGPTAGYLRQCMYIIVREPIKRYSAPGQPNAGREWPYQKIKITTLQTPETRRNGWTMTGSEPRWDLIRRFSGLG